MENLEKIIDDFIEAICERFGDINKEEVKSDVIDRIAEFRVEKYDLSTVVYNDESNEITIEDLLSGTVYIKASDYINIK